MPSISSMASFGSVVAMLVGGTTSVQAQAIPTSPFFETKTVQGTQIVSGEMGCEMRLSAVMKPADYYQTRRQTSPLLIMSNGKGAYSLTLEDTDVLVDKTLPRKFTFVTAVNRHFASMPFASKQSFWSPMDQVSLDSIALKKAFEIRQGDKDGILRATVIVPDFSAPLRALSLCRLARNRPARQTSNLNNDGSFAGIGRVGVTFTISDTGILSDCIVAPKGRNLALEANLCKRVIRDLRFSPATDAKGYLVSSTKTITVIAN